MAETAEAPAATGLPIFYQDLMPLNSRDHAKMKARPTDAAPWLVGQHAVPLTVEEFPLAQRYFPIVFSSGENPVPLALMGLNEGVNVFVDDDGRLLNPVYVPAYVRRYPFLLARLDPEKEDMSLCFDPASGLIVEEGEGEPLFVGDEISDATKAALEFCENFEMAGQRSGGFIEELTKHDLLMEGEVSITRDGQENPFIYRGFQMVNQEKLAEMRGDELRKWNQNGILALIYAHIFSLELMREIFERQIASGKGPIELEAAPAAAAPAPAKGKAKT